MSSIVDQQPYNEYVGNGIATVYPYEFQLLSASDFVASIDGTEVPASDYTLTGVGNQAGGECTFDTAPIDGAAVLLQRVIVLERDTDYQYNGDLREATLDRDFNRLWMAIQGQGAALSSAVRVPYPEQLGELPTQRASTLVGFNADGDLALIDQALAPERPFQFEPVHIATEGQVLFTFAQLVYTRGIGSLWVFANGRLFSVGADYAETSTSSITLTQGVPAGFEMRFIAGAPLNSTVVSDAALVAFMPAGASAVASTAQAKLREWVSVADKGAVGGVNEVAKFQLAIDDLPAGGGTILLSPNVNYSATVASTLTVGNKAVIWLVQNGATAPAGLPGMTMSQRYGATFIVSGEASRNGPTWHQVTGSVNVPYTEKGRAFHVEVTMPDNPAADAERDFYAYSYLLETDHHGPLGGEIRGVKGIVRGNGGQSNLRSAHFLAQGYNGHIGDLTGMAADVFHSDSADGVHAPVGRMAAVLGQVGPGSQSVFTARSRVTATTGKQRPSYGFRCEDGSLAILPNIACFYGHGGGVGDFFRMAASDTDVTVVASLDNLAKMFAKAFRSGATSVADDAVLSFTPVCETGFILVHLEGNSAHWIVCYFRANATGAVMTEIASGASASPTTGVLAGTTGVDTELTVSAHTNGLIYIENRAGGTKVATYLIAGRS